MENEKAFIVKITNIENVEKMKGLIGVYKGNRAIQITDIKDKDIKRGS